MAKRCPWITTSPGPQTSLHIQNTCERDAVWPPLPIFIRDWGHSISDMNNIFAALEHNDRVCGVRLWRVTDLELEEMQEPFPALTELELLSESEPVSIILNSFLGGYPPRLQSLSLTRISFPFPASRRLFLSATHLVDLYLWNIPRSGYISPRVMVTCISALTNLESLLLESGSRRSRPDQESRQPPTDALAQLMFRGFSEYLEDLVALIDAILLEYLIICFSHQPIFDTPQLAQFISRTSKFKAPVEARVIFSD